MFSISQHSISRWSKYRAFRQSTQHHMVVRSSCIPPVNTVPHAVRLSCIPPVNTARYGGQIIVHSTSQHSTTCGQIIVHSTSQHNTIWCRWSDHRAFHQSTQHDMVVTSSCIPPVNTVPHAVRLSCIPPVNTTRYGAGGQIIVHSTSQHSTIWWSDHRAFHQSTQYHIRSDHRAFH